MLNATFQCFRGIGENAELRLWENGCLCWRDFTVGTGRFLSNNKQVQVARQIKEASVALETGTADWFLNRLSGAAQLRVLNDFIDDTLFLDIETTGLTTKDELTTVATWRAGRACCFVKEINLSNLLYELASASLLVTYNGTRFDLPFLRRYFNIDLAMPHLDLMHPLRALGYRGGLKMCEERLAFTRTHSQGCDGAEAVRLWDAWKNKQNANALRQLVLYNVEDAYSLAWLAARLIPRSMPNYPLMPNVERPPPPSTAEILAYFAL